MTSVSLPLPKVRTSERTTLMRCEQKWVWAYMDNLQGKTKAPALTFGDLVHQALALYYKPEPKRNLKTKAKRGPHPVANFTQVFARLEKEGKDFSFKVRDDMAGEDEEEYVRTKAKDLGIEMLTNYMDRYGEDRRYRIIAPEMPFILPVHDPETKKLIFNYVGTVDALIEDLEWDRLAFFEHKTAASIYTGHLSFDEQGTSYWTYGPHFLRTKKILKPGQDIDYVYYNFLRKGYKDTRPTDEEGHALNQDGSVSKKQPSPLFAREIVRRGQPERDALHKRVLNQFRQMQELRAGRPPIKSILQGCTGLFSCEFKEMCELHEIGDDWKSYQKSMFRKWQPYEVHDELEKLW